MEFSRVVYITIVVVWQNTHPIDEASDQISIALNSISGSISKLLQTKALEWRSKPVEITVPWHM